MVVPLGPGKFYGTSLPRPRIYTDVKFNDHRVDPPVSVTDPLMSWAQEAHWSMGGLSFNRLRLQGKIEGNVEKLRSQREKAQAQVQAQSPLPPSRSDLRGPKRPASPSPPPAPVATKRRRFMALVEEEEEEKEDEEEEVKASSGAVRRRRLVKKLGDDFDRVASLENEGSDTILLKTRNRRLIKGGESAKKVVENKGNKEAEKSNVSGNGVRSSPRLAKRGSN